MNLPSSVLVAVVLAVSAAAYGMSVRLYRPRPAVAGEAAPGGRGGGGRGRIRGWAGAGRRRDDRGASALEWAVISAILVTAAVVIGGVIYSVVSDKSDQISSCGALGADAESCTEP